MARDNYEAGLLGETIGHDTFSYDYQMGARERERQASSGGGGGVGALAGAGGGGIVFAAMMVILAFCAFIVSFCTYPIAGMATLIGFGIGTQIVNGDGHNTMNGVGLVFALMIPCYILYMLTFQIEMKMGHVRVYQIFRHYWRLAVGTFVAHILGESFHMKSQFPDGAPLSGYLTDYAITITAFFFLYLNSQRLDEKYELEPVETQWINRIVDPALKWLFPVVPWNLRETGILVAKTAQDAPIEIEMQPGQNLRVGEDIVPVQFLTITEKRKHRGRVALAGLALLFGSISLVDALFGFDDFFPYLLSGAGMALGFFLAVSSLGGESRPGRLQAPFRWLQFSYPTGSGINKLVELQFRKRMDEKVFRRALMNAMRDYFDAQEAQKQEVKPKRRLPQDRPANDEAAQAQSA